VPDPEGFVRIKDLLKALQEEPGWKHVRRAGIDELVISLPNAPVEIAENRIRAVDRRHLPTPEAVRDLPRLLYICVRRRAHPVVVSKGMRSAEGGWLVLSDDRVLALRLGKRIDASPVLLTVHTGSRAARSVIFFSSGEHLFLARSLPPDCLSGPPLPKEKKTEPKGPAKPLAPKEPGSFYLDPTRSRPGGRPQPDPAGRSRGKSRKKGRKPRRERPPWRS